jgi:predicted transcriptional regulator
VKDDYIPRVCIPLQPGTLVEHPIEMPELVHMHDPATMAFIDFTRIKPEVIKADKPIDEALEKMKASGVSLLLVIDDAGAVEGILTWEECYGDAPIILAQSSHIDHSKIKVCMVMTLLPDIKVLEWSHMKDACVGHIVATLHHIECQHLLVIEQHKVRGVFVASRIAKQIGHAVTEDAVPAHSLAEIVHILG